MMNMNKLAAIVAGTEGKKFQLSIAQIKDVLAIVSDLLYLDHNVALTLIKNGEKRAARIHRTKRTKILP